MEDFRQYIDLTEFTTEVGYTAVIRYCINKNIDSFYCGYVQVPKESVLHGLHWHEDPTDILQMGTDEGDSWIDWSGDMNNLMGRPDTPSGIWAFGFDTMHPSWTTSRLAAELSKDDNLTVASYDYIKNTCEILAKRLKIIHDNNPLDQQAKEVPATCKESLQVQTAQPAKETVRQVQVGNNPYHVADVLTDTQPAKETETMELPWQDISTLKGYKHDGLVALWHGEFNQQYLAHSVADAVERVKFSKSRDDVSKYTHWYPVTPPKAKTVEAPPPPEKPEQITIEEAYESDDFYYIEDRYPKHVLRIHKPVGTQWRLSVAKQILELNENHTVFYATDPWTWLVSQAKQEGKNE